MRPLCVFLVVLVLLCSLATVCSDRSYFIIDSNSIPTRSSNGAYQTNNATTYQVNFFGTEGGLTIEQLIQLIINGQEMLIQITVIPKRIPVRIVGTPSYWPEIVQLFLQKVGSSNVATFGATPPEDLVASTDAPTFQVLMSTKEVERTLLGRHPSLQASRIAHHAAMQHKVGGGETGLSPAQRGLLQINNPIDNPLISIDNQGFLQPTADRFGINNIWNPPGYIDQLDGRESALALLILLNDVLPPGVNPAGITALKNAIVTQMAAGNPSPGVSGFTVQPDPSAPSFFTKCLGTDGSFYETFGVPCAEELFPVITNVQQMTCLGAMRKRWLQDVATYGPCTGWAANIAPNSSWCSGGNDAAWVAKAVEFITNNQEVSLQLSISNQTCFQPPTNFGTTNVPFGIVPIPGDSTGQVLCDLPDPRAYTVASSPQTNALQCFPGEIGCIPGPVGSGHAGSTGLLLDSAGFSQPFNLPMGGGLTAPKPGAKFQYDPTKPETWLYTYYDSPQCPCALTDDTDHIVCPVNPWTMDGIDFAQQNVNQGTPFYRVGQLQKCTPIVGPDTIQQFNNVEEALAQGGSCGLLNSAVTAFDYSSEQTERIRPLWPDSCGNPTAEDTRNQCNSCVTGFCIGMATGCSIPFGFLFPVCFATCMGVMLPGGSKASAAVCPEVCQCAIVTITRGALGGQQRDTAVAQQALGVSQLLGVTAGMINSLRNQTQYLTNTIAPALANATAGLNNLTIALQASQLLLSVDEYVQMNATLLLNDSVSQTAFALNQLLTSQRTDQQALGQINNLTGLLFSQLQSADYNFSVSMQQHTLQAGQQIQAMIQQGNLLYVNNDGGDRQLNQVAAQSSKSSMQLDIYLQFFQDVQTQVNMVATETNLTPMIDPCTFNATSNRLVCGVLPTGIPIGEVVATASAFPYALEWQSGFGDSVEAPNLATQKPKIHQWNYVMSCPTGVLFNYHNITTTIDQMREMVAPGACSVVVTHSTCISSVPMNTLISAIAASKGEPNIFALSTLMSLSTGAEGSSHLCAGGAVTQVYQNTSLFTYQWDQALTDQCTTPNLMQAVGWPGFVTFMGGTPGYKMYNPANASYCQVDKFSRTLASVILGIDTAPTALLAVMDVGFSFAIGATGLIQRFQQYILGQLSTTGLTQELHYVSQPHNASSVASGYSEGMNLTAVVNLLMGPSTSGNVINQTVDFLQSKQFVGFLQVMGYSFVAAGPNAVPVHVVVFDTQVLPNITVQMSQNLSAGFTSLDQDYSNVVFFQNASLASVSYIFDETKYLSSTVGQQILATYIDVFFNDNGIPIPKTNSPTTTEKRARYIYNLNSYDVALWARTSATRKRTAGYWQSSLEDRLAEQFLNETIQLVLNQVPWKNNFTNNEPPWGQSALSRHNFSSSSWATMIPFNTNITEHFLDEIWDRRILLTNTSIAHMQEFIGYVAEDASVSLADYLMPILCTNTIAAAPFNDWKLIKCQCSCTDAEKATPCQWLDAFMFAVPISWLVENGGVSADFWDHFFVQTVNQTIEFQVVLPASLTQQVGLRASFCPQSLSMVNNVFQFQKPNFGSDVTLAFNMSVVSTQFGNETAALASPTSSLDDCQAFVTSQRSAGWSALFVPDTNRWNLTKTIVYPAATDVASIQPTASLPTPSATSTCQLLHVDITRVGGAQPPLFCGSWTSTGVQSDAALASLPNIQAQTDVLAAKSFTSTFEVASSLFQYQQTAQNIMTNILGVVGLGAASFQDGLITSGQIAAGQAGDTAALLAQAGGAIQTVSAGSVIYSPSVNVTQLVTHIFFNATTNLTTTTYTTTTTTSGASDTLYTYYFGSSNSSKPTAVPSLANSTGAQYNATWTAEPDALAAQYTILLKALTAAYNTSGISEAQAVQTLYNALIAAIDASLTVNSIQPFVDLFNAQQAKLNLSAAVANAFTNPVWRDRNNLGCIYNIYTLMQNDPQAMNNIVRNFQAAYLAGGQSQSDNTNDGSPGAILNGYTYDQRVALGFLFWTSIWLLFVIFVIALLGALDLAYDKNYCCFCAQNCGMICWWPCFQQKSLVVEATAVPTQGHVRYTNEEPPEGSSLVSFD